MPTVAGATNTNNALGFIGNLYQKVRRTNALLRMIGAVTGVQPTAMNADTLANAGWEAVNNYEFVTNLDYDLPAPSQPSILEGANAPTPNTSQNTQAKNVVQIFHEAVEVTYLKESTNNRLASTGVLTAGLSPEDLALAAQQDRVLQKIAQDVNHSFLNGAFANPANPTSTALRTRGLRTAITTNVLANGGTPRALTKALLQNLYKARIDNGGAAPESLTLLTNTNQMAVLTDLYTTEFSNGQDRFVGGVQVRTIYTAFGLLNVVLEMDMPQTEIVFVDPNVISGKVLNVPGKGSGLFYEELSKTGSANKGQFYGQMGFDHGPEWAHAKLVDLT